jgi:hypothetical protein
VAVAVVGSVILSVRDLPLPTAGEIAGQAGRNAAVAALLGAFGIGIGGLVRNQVVAVVALLVLSFVVEPLVVGLAPHVGRYGPLGALPVAAAGLDAESSGMEGVDLVSTPLAVLALLAWIGVVWGAAAALLVRRDLD